MEFRFTLSDEEFARAWIREYYRRPGWRALRIFGGPAFVALGVLLALGPGAFTRLIGVATIALGVWYAVKPLLAQRMVVRQRRASGRADLEVRLTLSEGGIALQHGHGVMQIPWGDVTAAGRSEGYLWYELKRGARATIPYRAVEDRARLEGFFQNHTPWKG